MIQVENGVGLSIVIFRGCVLLIAAFAGGMSILLGWHLYRIAVLPGPAAELNSKPWKARLAAGIAGALLAIFGMIFLVFLANSQSNIASGLIFKV